MSFALRFERSRGLVVCHVGVTAQPPFPCYHSVRRVEGLLCPLRSRDNYYFLFSSVEKRVSSSTDVGVIRPLRWWYPHIVGYVIEREAAPSTSSNTQPCVFFIHLLHPSLCPRLASYLPRAKQRNGQADEGRLLLLRHRRRTACDQLSLPRTPRAPPLLRSTSLHVTMSPLLYSVAWQLTQAYGPCEDERKPRWRQ